MLYFSIDDDGKRSEPSSDQTADLKPTESKSSTKPAKDDVFVNLSGDSGDEYTDSLLEIARFVQNVQPLDGFGLNFEFF